jgi:hypothetical protein
VVAHIRKIHGIPADAINLPVDLDPLPAKEIVRVDLLFGVRAGDLFGPQIRCRTTRPRLFSRRE